MINLLSIVLLLPKRSAVYANVLPQQACITHGTLLRIKLDSGAVRVSIGSTNQEMTSLCVCAFIPASP